MHRAARVSLKLVEYLTYLNRYSLCAHFARAHAVGESFGVSAYRNLPNSHPMFRVLQPHIQGIVPVNVQARNVVFKSEEGGFSMFLGVGDSTRQVFENYFKQFSYDELNFPKSVEERGVQDIPEYLHRDDMLESWALVESYITEMVNLAYPGDEDVEKDDEIQNFVREIAECGFRRFPNNAGFPKSLPSKKKLVEYLTSVVFNFSFYHASVNFQTFTISYCPNTPTVMRAPPPTQDEVVTTDRILDSLPVGEVAFLGYNVGYNLGIFSPIERFWLGDSGENKLGIIGENMAVSPEQEACIRKLTEGMRAFKHKIDRRNEGRYLKFDLLSPTNVPLTTQT